MASGKSPRRSLPFPKPTDADKICADIESLTTALDNDAETAQGTLAGKSGPGTRGRFYFVEGDATPVNNGVLWWDTGTEWKAISPHTGNPSTRALAVSGEAKNGETIAASKEITVTLPAVEASARVTVVNVAGGAEIVTIKQHAAETINGDFISGAATIKLVPGQHVTLGVDATPTNWWIIGGEPKRTSVYSAPVEVTDELEVEPSATRPAIVIISVGMAVGGTVTITVGGVALPALESKIEGGATGTYKFTTTLFVEPGVKWKLHNNTALVKSFYSTKLL